MQVFRIGHTDWTVENISLTAVGYLLGTRNRKVYSLKYHDIISIFKNITMILMILGNEAFAYTLGGGSRLLCDFN